MNRNYEVEKECNRELAKCCVPFQIMNEVYNSQEALKKGTLFPELYRPYVIGERRDIGGRYYG